MSPEFHVAILDDHQDAARRLDCFGLMRDLRVTSWRDTTKDENALAARLADCDAVVLIRERSHLRASLLERLPRLKLVCQTGGSVGTIDVDTCTRLGIAVCCARNGTPRYAWASSQASAEFTWALILGAMRRLVENAAALARGDWQADEIGTTVRGRVLGVLGYGRIGAQVAAIGRAFGMHPLAWGREQSRARAAADGVEWEPTQRALFARADVLTVHVALGEATRGLITAADFAAMKPTALFVNTSRAGLVAPGALVAALRSGRPGRAAVDVYENEPLRDAAHPLLTLPNVLATPHVAFVEQDSYEASFGNAFRQIRGFLSGEPLDVVNPEALRVAPARGR